MGRKTKQKSCFACVETKRRCDKRHPSCSRCLDLESVCTYPSMPRRQPLDLIEAGHPPLWALEISGPLRLRILTWEDPEKRDGVVAVLSKWRTKHKETGEETNKTNVILWEVKLIDGKRKLTGQIEVEAIWRTLHLMILGNAVEMACVA